MSSVLQLFFISLFVIIVYFLFCEVFSKEDIVITDGTKGNFRGSGSFYELDVEPLNNFKGTMKLSIDVNKAIGVGGDGNEAITYTQEVDTQKPFITTWDTTKDGNSSSNQIKIVTNPEYDYKYSIDWGDGTLENAYGDKIHTYSTEGNYTIKITGEFPSLYFNEAYYYSETPANPCTFDVSTFDNCVFASPNDRWRGVDDNEKLLSVNQWGTIEWKSMKRAFYYCSNMESNATDSPNLSSVYDMSEMFEGARVFNDNISNWNVSNVNLMTQLFYRASAFNQNLSSWDISNVLAMKSMFEDSNLSTQNYNDIL